MDRLSITTHLIAILTAFSAFTMPIAIEVLNRVKSRYGSAHYMDCIEKIMGFKVHLLFRELIFFLITLVFFSLLVSTLNKYLMPDEFVRLWEILFSILTASILFKEFVFIRTILLATRSDDLVVDHLISTLTTNSKCEDNHSEEVELLIQIACYNLENTVTTTNKSTENRLFDLIENVCLFGNKNINYLTVKKLVEGLAATIASARKTNNRDKYVSVQRKYGRVLILFFDRKIKNHDIFDLFSNNLYEESIKELNTDQYWLLKADFFIGIDVWNGDIQSFGSVKFINEHVRNLIDFLADKKPSIVVDLLDNYRRLVQFESYFENDIYQLSSLFDNYNIARSHKVSAFVEENKKLLSTNPQEYSDKFVLLLDEHVQDALRNSNSESRRAEIKHIAAEYEAKMKCEIIKAVFEIEAKNMAEYGLSALARKGNWNCILDCCDSFNPAYSKIHRLGVNIVKSSLSSVIKRLGALDFFGGVRDEEIKHAYIRAVPILTMYAVYSWRIKNLDKKLEDCFSQIVSSVNVRDGNIQSAQVILRNLKNVTYYAKSPVYANVFCEHFGLEHERSDFSKFIISILVELQCLIEKQIVIMKRTQPLSRDLKQDYIDKALMKGVDIPNKYPLFSRVSLSRTKKTTPIEFRELSYEREWFLDNTGVAYLNPDLGYIDCVHNLLAIKLISEHGCSVSTLDLDKFDENLTLVISSKDWADFSRSIDPRKHKNLKRVIVRTDQPLGAFFAFDALNSMPFVTIYSTDSNEESVALGDNIKNAFTFEFIEENEQVKVKTEAHIYF